MVKIFVDTGTVLVPILTTNPAKSANPGYVIMPYMTSSECEPCCLCSKRLMARAPSLKVHKHEIILNFFFT